MFAATLKQVLCSLKENLSIAKVMGIKLVLVRSCRKIKTVVGDSAAEILSMMERSSHVDTNLLVQFQ